MATCPECDADVEVNQDDVDLGDEVSCNECGQTLVISNTDPLELDFAPDDEDEEDEEEDEPEEDDEVEEDEEEEDGADRDEE